MSEDRKLGPVAHPDTEIKEKIFSEEQFRKYDQIVKEGDLMDDDQWRRFKATNREPVKVHGMDKFHERLANITKAFFGPERKTPQELVELIKKREL